MVAKLQVTYFILFLKEIFISWLNLFWRMLSWKKVMTDLCRLPVNLNNYSYVGILYQHVYVQWSKNKNNKHQLIKCQWTLSSRDAYLHPKSGSSLIQVMTCGLFASICSIYQSWLLLTWESRNKPQWIFSSIQTFSVINSSDAGDGIIRLWWSIPCLLMH